MKQFAELLAIILYVTGWVFTQSAWQLFFAVIFPPYSLYIVIEKILISMGWL